MKRVYMVSTPNSVVVYESARDALGVFETTNGEYKVESDFRTYLVPVTPTNIAPLLRELDRTDILKFTQPGCSITGVKYFESHGAK